MASGSSGRNNSGSKGFDFATTDDILCSYEDYGNQESSNGSLSDPAIGSNSAAKHEFHKSRMARSSMFPAPTYNPPEDSFNQDLISTVEMTMKKYADNLMRFLEGLSSRLSQLELYCYNLDKSIGEMRSDLVRDHGDADLKLKSLEKHLQEVSSNFYKGICIFFLHCFVFPLSFLTLIFLLLVEIEFGTLTAEPAVVMLSSSSNTKLLSGGVDSVE